MKFALISDIHANAPALRAALEFISPQRDIEKIFCLGDVVGFNTSPGECIDLIQDHRVECIAGNHDAGVTGKMVEKQFPRECWEAIQWTRKNISSRHLKFLESLSTQSIVDRRFWLMHGIFGDPYHYMVGNGKHRYAFARMRLSGIRLGFYGHIHKQTCYKSEGVFSHVTSIEPFGTVPIDRDASYLINPGTIGQPRVKNAEAQFAIVDTELSSVTFHRIPYDYATVLERTLEVFPTHAAMYRRFGSLPQLATRE
jgi:predicted phosphodiesterase